jgi:DNA invertase Pin-like site-specific DNA recombinase
MMDTVRQKVTSDHLTRDAYLYVRQSTLQQVFQNTESTRRQYDLRRRAVALGWPEDRVVVIDNDLGLSGASAVDREGFKRLVGDVGLGKAGIVLGLEVSRLARNSSDWHRLLEICALSDTLILDEDGLYNPGDFNDRLLLGMKGTMSEAELHVLRARLQGGILSKARRGELRSRLPVGLSYDACGKVILNPDQQVQDTLRVFFKTYQRTGSAMGVVIWFREQGIHFPRVITRGPNKGKIAWGPLTHSRAVNSLRNPRYSGAFVFGRTKFRKRVDGSHYVQVKPQEEWDTVIPDAHPGYISWQEYNANLNTLRACAKAHGTDRRDHPPGEGPALLQGMLVCGVCGRRMTVRYHTRGGEATPDYVCQGIATSFGVAKCQGLVGGGIDKAVAELLLELVEPVTLELAMRVQEEVQGRLDEADALRRQSVERAQYLADLARERFMAVDPRNRLVADQLEADWNEKLRLMQQAHQHCEDQREKDRVKLDDDARRRILALAKDFPRVWNAPATTAKQRKRMIRLLVEDVTLTRMKTHARVQVRLRGGQTRTFEVAHPLSAGLMRKTPTATIGEIDLLFETYTDGQAAEELNRRGVKSSMGQRFTPTIVAKLRRAHGLSSRYERLRRKGLLTKAEIAKELDVHWSTIGVWHQHGLLKGYDYNDKGERLYELPPEEQRPAKLQGRKLAERAIKTKVPPHAANKVQHDA